ncbi:MAG TPA: N-acetyltransferase [Thermoplasmata archaeon]|nr:N-acetyltransferase [Thermoplasmata archaeon]
MPTELSDSPGPGVFPSPPRPATAARSDVLLELTHGLRAELLRRGEYLPGGWVEEAANDLKAGRLRGWVLDGGDDPRGLAFFSPRKGRAYGHAHVTAGPDSLARMRQLLDALRSSLPTPGARLDVGVTGLADEEEAALGNGLVSSRGESAVVRLALEVAVSAGAPVALPDGLQPVAIRTIPLESLATLDWTSFQGTPDQSLVADTPADDAHVLEEILRGLLGRFLDEASTGLADARGELLGFLLTAEQTPRRAIFLDLVIRPTSRGQGLGRYLLTWGMRALSALGYETARLWVTESNVVARRLYDELGFQPKGRALIVRFQGDERATASPPQPHRSR